MRGEVARLEAEPVDARDPYRVVVGIEDLASHGVQIAVGHAGLRAALAHRDIADRDAWEGDGSDWSDRACDGRIAPVVAPGEAEATGGHRRNSRVEVGQLPRGAGIVAVERPHREHPQPLGPGECLEAIGILQGKHFAGDVVHAQHRRHSQLVPAKCLALAGEQRGHLRKGGVGGIDGILAHRLERWRGGAVAIVHRHHIDAVDLHAGHQGGLHHVDAVLRETLWQHRQGEPYAQIRPGLLHHRDGVHLQLERLGFGNGGALDIEVDLGEVQRVHHVAVGGRQGRHAEASPGIRLCQ